MRAREQASAVLGEMMNTAGGTIDDEWMTLTRSGLMPLCAGFLPCCDQVSRGWRFANFSSLLYILPCGLRDHLDYYRPIRAPWVLRALPSSLLRVEPCTLRIFPAERLFTAHMPETCQFNLHEINELGLTNIHCICFSSS